MNNTNEIKEANERACWEKAVKVASEKSNNTGKIMRLLDGEIINRDRNDSPDLILRCYFNGITPVFIGVEHFFVSQLSEKRIPRKEKIGAATKKNNFISMDKKYYSKIRKVRKRGCEEIHETGDVSENTSHEMLKNVGKLATQIFTKGYKEFLSAFHEHLQYHISNTDKYRRTVQRFADSNDVKIVFLIEIKTEFRDLVLCKDKNTQIECTGLMPMFKEIVTELERVDTASVDYIVLLLESIININTTDVIALKTGNINEQLLAQGITVYKYCATTLMQPPHIESAVRNKNKNWKLNFSCECNIDEKTTKDFMLAFERAYWARQKNIPYAITKDAERLLEKYDKFENKKN